MVCYEIGGGGGDVSYWFLVKGIAAVCVNYMSELLQN